MSSPTNKTPGHGRWPSAGLGPVTVHPTHPGVGPRAFEKLLKVRPFRFSNNLEDLHLVARSCAHVFNGHRRVIPLLVTAELVLIIPGSEGLVSTPCTSRYPASAGRRGCSAQYPSEQGNICYKAVACIVYARCFIRAIHSHEISAYTRTPPPTTRRYEDRGHDKAQGAHKAPG